MDSHLPVIVQERLEGARRVIHGQQWPINGERADIVVRRPINGQFAEDAAKDGGELEPMAGAQRQYRRVRSVSSHCHRAVAALLTEMGYSPGDLDLLQSLPERAATPELRGV